MIRRPYRASTNAPKPLRILDAEGVYLYTEDAKLIDSISSKFCVIHGYRHPLISAAITKQAERFSYVMMDGLKIRPVEQLASKLANMLPGDLNHAFFSESSGVAIETALKMALLYYVNRGERARTKVASLIHARHGDTFKAMEIGDDENERRLLSSCGELNDTIRIPTDVRSLEETFERRHNEMNCLIVEPLLQAAGGMRTYDVSFLKRARELCDQYDVLLIFDETVTGFGRTGNRFVADLVQPDVLCLGESLTGGSAAFAATVANDKVYRAFYDSDARRAFMRGSAFMGNPLACAAALTSVSLFENENYMDKIAKIEAIERREFSDFTDERVREVRILGACVCVEVKDPNYLTGYRDFAYKRGVFASPFSCCLYAAPPYVIQEDELVQSLDCMKAWFQC